MTEMQQQTPGEGVADKAPAPWGFLIILGLSTTAILVYFFFFKA